ncbi:ABC transporter related [Staphylothermus marinus F1]|uniref:ABC transporter related n=1 Tax=Staphylothermus marinus (strain ATCC 43588 / DSM 3639 / JCM 9404 / F1) TaxID=399550 RepID=A3DLV4_STAMF|nr:ABC transporter ATP-binding protein [Staphylothermus marinus]ABN69614.1 ABC transporter related [Staphylothermus marinus F1]
MITALKNIDITIKDNVVTCIMGPNGAGKTTLLKTIAKITSYDGSIYIDGKELREYPLRTISKLISYVSQIEAVDILSLTVKEALLTARYPVSKAFFETYEDLRIVEEVSKMLQINNLLDRRLSELSSGELQRVVLGLGLVKKPKYLLLDEPDNHMDLNYKARLIEWIRDWRRFSNILLTTHDIMFGTDVGEYFIILDRGTPVFIGDKDDLLKHYTILEKIYGVKIAKISVDGKTRLIPLYEVIS